METETLVKVVSVILMLVLVIIRFRKQIVRLVSGTSAVVSTGTGTTPASPTTTVAGVGGTSRNAWSIAVGVIGLGLVVWGLFSPDISVKDVAVASQNRWFAIVIACTVITALIAINSWPKALYSVVWGTALMLFLGLSFIGWASGSKTAAEVVAEKEAAERAAKAPAVVPAPVLKKVRPAVRVVWDECTKVRPCTPRPSSIEGMTEKVSVPVEWGVCTKGGVSSGLWVSKLGMEREYTSSNQEFDTFWFVLEDGEVPPPYWFVPKSSDRC